MHINRIHTYLLLSLLSFLLFNKSLGQDVHFSHLHASPLHLNPSLTGLFNADFRMIGNVRQQWQHIGVNYQTASLSADGHWLQFGKHDFLSAGVQIISDKAGDLDLGTTQGHFSLSLAKALDRFGDQFISIGIRSSMINQHVDLASAKVFEQDPLFPLYAQMSKTYQDLSAGFSWFYNGRHDQIAYLGAAVFHIFNPHVSFTTRPDLGGSFGDRLYTRWVAHGGLETDSRGYFKFMPSFIFMKQGPHQEITFGTFVKYNRSMSISLQSVAPSFYWGAWLRGHGGLDTRLGIDALIMSMRVDKGKLAYTISYDLNISSLSRASKLQGGPEISVIFFAKNPYRKKKRKKMKCPSF